MEYVCEFKLVDFGSLKALATVKFDGFEIRGFKIIATDEGAPWVGMPSREVVRDGKKEYFDIVRFEDPEKRREFQEKVLGEYSKAIGEPAKKKGAKCRK